MADGDNTPQWAGHGSDPYSMFVDDEMNDIWVIITRQI